MSVKLLGSAAMAAAAPAAAPAEKPPCLRANAALGVACVGLALAVVFGVVAKVGDDDVGASGQLLSGLVFLVLGILSFFQRSIEAQVIQLGRENERFGEENDELRETRDRLDQENREFDRENEELRATRAELDRENEELQATRARLDEENREFDQSNRALSEQVASLNQLHNKSVQTIRQLALYGDECKNFGRELGGIKDGLQETDDSLGLTAAELKAQVDALSAVAKAMRQA